MVFGKLGIGILAGALTLGSGGAAVAAGNALGVVPGGDRQARCEAYQRDLAQNLGITVEQLRAARQKTALQLIDERLAAGAITAEQAQRAKDKVNASQGACAAIGQRQAAKAEIGKAELKAVARRLGITEKELVQELKGGKSLAQVAQARNVSRDQLKATLHDTFKAELDKRVAAKKLTQDQANTALAAFDARLDTLIDRTKQK